MLRLEERFTVPVTPETAWAFLLDAKRLAPCIPGCDGLEVVDERTYRLRLAIKVGFLSTHQDMRMEIVEAEPPRRLVSEGRGEDSRLGSRVEVRISLELSAAGEGGTAIAYASEVTVLGRLGSIGDAVMKVKARELAGVFAQNVKAALEGRGMIAVDFTLNGRPCRTEVPDHWTVLDLLRDGLALNGTKYGCGEGVCGTCTVLLDGEPVRACLVLASRLRGRAVLTVEGLAHEGEPDSLQAAFARTGAVQCGFCTPGMLLAAHALLARNPSPSEHDVREALAGNLCRCTGYTKIIEVVLAAAGGR